jgi:hypothetical protein
VRNHRVLALLVFGWASAALGGDTHPLASRLDGRQCLLFRYVGSDRNATVLYVKGPRRPIVTYVEGDGGVRYVAEYKIRGVPLELPKTMSLPELRQWDGLLEDQPKHQGFRPGDVVVVEEVKPRKDGVEVKVRGVTPDQRKGKLVFKLGSPESADDAYDALLRVALPGPPFRSEEEETRAILAHAGQMEASRLAEWLGRDPAEISRRVAAQALARQGGATPEGGPVRECFEACYRALSDDAGLALIEMRSSADGVLLARLRTQQPVLGRWDSEVSRAQAVFEWTVTKVIQTLPRRCPKLAATAYRVEVEYEYRDQGDLGSERLVSLVPAAMAAEYAARRITAADIASQAEHQLNGMRVSLGERRR